MNPRKVILLLNISILLPYIAIFPIIWAERASVRSKIPSAPSDEALQQTFDRLTYGTGLWRMAYEDLLELVGGIQYMNYGNYCQVIDEYLVPIGVRSVFLFIGWTEHANTMTTDVGYKLWVDEWLSACDRYGIAVFFYFDEWGHSSAAPSWWADVIETYSELASNDKTGHKAPLGDESNPIVIDSPLLVDQLKEDLKQLYQYYGYHPSWLGAISGYYGSLANYARTDNKMNPNGFSNYTLDNFVNSIYYSRDVNATGYHEDGTKCILWESYGEKKSLVLLSSGQGRQQSRPLDIYGGMEGRIFAMSFVPPQDLNGFKIKWYGRKIGNPQNPLIFELCEDKDGQPDFTKILENVSQPVQYIAAITQPAWQDPVFFTTELMSNKTYWVIMYTSGGSTSNKYEVYRRTYKTDESTAIYATLRYKWGYEGGAILWLQDVMGVDKRIYPYQEARIAIGEATFIPTSNITFNTVFLHVADRYYDQASSILKIVRVSDGATLAEGILNQTNIKGLWYWVPILLNRRISIIMGEIYKIELEIPPGTVRWDWHTLMTDPASQGFQGYPSFKLFSLADMDFSSIQNFLRVGPYAGAPTARISEKEWLAVRFRPLTSSNLQNVSVKIQFKYGNSSGLRVTLRNDLDGKGLRPSNVDIESKTLMDEKVPTTGWTFLGGWNSSLEANNYYWLVFSTIGTGPGYELFGMVNPIEYYTIRTYDEGLKWERLADVAELIFEARTSNESFRVEPDEYDYNLRITDTQLIAQSFSPASNMTADGILLFITSGPDPGCDLTVELRAESGLDAPFSMALTSGVLAYTNIVRGLYYVDFKVPYDLVANRRYWLVLKSSANSGINCPVFFYGEPEESYGGITCKAKCSTDGGINWFLPDGKEGDVVFSVVQAPYKVYPDISELAQDIEQYHTHAIDEEPIHGWNAYLNSQTSKIQKEVTEWFEKYTGKRWYSFDVNTMEVIKEVDGVETLSLLDFGALYNASDNAIEMLSIDRTAKLQDLLKSGGIALYPWFGSAGRIETMRNMTPEEIGVYYRATVPFLSRSINFFDYDPGSLKNLTQMKFSKEFGGILNRMRYYGEYYGTEKGMLDVLLIGGEDMGIMPQYLTPALNITLINLNEVGDDYNFTEFGSFKQFDVIVWLSDKSSVHDVTTSVQDRIKTFVRDGGGCVVTRLWPDWINPILGYDATDKQISPGIMDYVNYSHPIVKPYENISGYISHWRTQEIIPINLSVKYIVRDTNGIPWISANVYGLGKGILCGMPESGISDFGKGTPIDSYLVLLNNAIFCAANKEGMLPVWWHSSYEIEHYNQLTYSICGKPGNPILLWLTNNGPEVPFEIHLNGSFYGLDPRGWIAIDISTGEVCARDVGTDISIKTIVPTESWKPIYLVNQTFDLGELYTNTYLLNRMMYPGQCLYMLSTPFNWTSYLIVKSLEPVAEVWLNDIVLPHNELSHESHWSVNSRVPPLDPLKKQDLGNMEYGWFYDAENQLLYVKFKSTGNNEVRVIQEENLADKTYLYLLPVIIMLMVVLEVVVYIHQIKTKNPF